MDYDTGGNINHPTDFFKNKYATSNKILISDY
jgi:hypothetical protein